MNLNDHVDLGFACLAVAATAGVSAVTTAMVVRVRHRDVRRQAAEIRRWADQAPRVREAGRPVHGPVPLAGLVFEPGTGTAPGSPSMSPSLAPAEGFPAGAAPAGPFPGDFFPVDGDAPGVGRLFETELSSGLIFEAPPGPVSGPPSWPPFPAGDQPAGPGAPLDGTPLNGVSGRGGAADGGHVNGHDPMNGDPGPGRMAGPGLRTEPGRPWDPGRDGFEPSGRADAEPDPEPVRVPEPEPVDDPDRPPAHEPEFLPPDTRDTVIIPRITSEMIAAGVLNGEVVPAEPAAEFRPPRLIPDPPVPTQREPHIRPAVPGKGGKPARTTSSGGRHRAARR
ncbi:hypothetical protein [Hamadaea tsunoensis]|uniref:hypothetical protein n=1 Tax=Hamadaea tsunoensis TaxID=53368 RepID=UPI0004237700|nr:hypothetical protein [Hamadaea tsunoensis]